MRENKMILSVILTVVFCAGQAYAQEEAAQIVQQNQTTGSMPVGFGATFIDGETFYLVNIAPEVSFGNIGIGLDLNLRFSTSGKLRTNDFVKLEDYLRVIRFIRWAHKGDPFYTRVGQLDYSLLGHGSIIYNYRNSASYDLRRTGIELDLNFEKFGFESMYSNIAGKGLLGVRPYVKPLKFTSWEKVPVINNFEIGMTYARDLNDQADITSADSSNKGLSIIGFDIGLPIISYSKIKSTLYFDYAKIVNYGHGSSVGIDLFFSGLDLVELRGKYELRFNGDRYLPAYFNALYEYDRYDLSINRSKSDTLKNITSNRGYYGELLISVLNTFHIIAGYQAPFDIKNEGILHAELQLPAVADFVLRGAYDKTRIGKVFKFDNYTILSAEIGYKVAPFLMISTLYQRTFSNRNPDGTIRSDGTFVKQDRVEPKVSLLFEF
ncbi:MAG: hypothetical protein JXA06_04670 [Bacteroidetes bacterium]|nr:hypothetical protein [Bacteroidota bacterium]